MSDHNKPLDQNQVSNALAIDSADLSDVEHVENDPQPSNTGVSGKILGESVKYSIDWLTYSFPLNSLHWDVSPVIEKFMDHNWATDEVFENSRYVEPFLEGTLLPSGFIEPEHELFQFTRLLRAFPGYTDAVEMGVGRLDWHSSNPRQGGLVNFSGQDCSIIQAAGVDFLVMLSHALCGLNGNVSRLDFAVDIFSPVNPQDVETAWKEQRVITSAKSAHPHPEYNQKGKLIGYTFYIGSGASERMVRVYDKAAREGVPGPWVRIELQTRAGQAVALAKTMLLNGVISGGKAFLRDFIQVQGLTWLTEACSGSGGEFLQPIERKETDRQRWYREQIIPALRDDLSKGDVWLRFQVQAVLDDTEQAEQHGGVKSIKNSNKAFYGMQVLEREGFKGAGFRRDFEVIGKDFIVSMCERFGYVWNTKAQRWEK